MTKLFSCLIAAVLIVFVLVTPVFAEEPLPRQQTGDTGGFGTALGIPGHSEDFDSYKDWIEAIYNFSIRLGGILTLLMLIYAGYKYMMSQGNPTAINEAKEILFGSLSGFALLLLVFFILKFLNVSNPIS